MESMQRSRAQLLELVRTSLWGKELDISLFEQGVNWDEVIRLSKEQTLMGVVSIAIETLPDSLRPSRSQVLRLHQMATLNRQYRSYQIEVLGKLLEVVKRAGVERPVLLKGLGVGLNYPDPTLRQCGDIDLYVGERYYFQVWNLLSEEFGVAKDESHSNHHFDFKFMDTHIEIHRYISAPSSVAYGKREFTQWSASQLEGDKLRKVNLEGVEVYLPPYNLDFIFIFYHTWRHFLTGGVGLRQLCDWTMYTDKFHSELEFAEIYRLLKIFRLEGAISLFATIAVEALGLSPDRFGGVISTSNKNYSKALDRVWDGGNFGFYRKGRNARSRTVFERKWRSLRAQLQDMSFIFSIDWLYAVRFYSSFFTERLSLTFKYRKELSNKL